VRGQFHEGIQSI